MPRFRKLLSGRGTRPAPVFQLIPRQPLTAGYFLLQVEPAIRSAIAELTDSNVRHVLTELALTTYLMGMGFDYTTAKCIVECWERDDILLSQGILTE
ncbi:MAG: hypothetical protein H6Q72_3637 [Firmicutes bacterium]|nr:hypothetical protein [Bacillota bacterium]